VPELTWQLRGTAAKRQVDGVTACTHRAPLPPPELGRWNASIDLSTLGVDGVSPEVASGM